MENNDVIYKEIGHLTRALYNVLKELGIGETLSHSSLQLPDTEDRLLFIAKATEDAAHKVLNIAEESHNILEKMLEDIPEGVSEAWILTYKERLLKLNMLQNSLFESQEYQDLTGQVLTKLISTTKQLQRDLAHLLLLYQQQGVVEDTLDGPSLDSLDDNSKQKKVDELLKQLGF